MRLLRGGEGPAGPPAQRPSLPCVASVPSQSLGSGTEQGARPQQGWGGEWLGAEQPALECQASGSPTAARLMAPARSQEQPGSGWLAPQGAETPPGPAGWLPLPPQAAAQKPAPGLPFCYRARPPKVLSSPSSQTSPDSQAPSLPLNLPGVPLPESPTAWPRQPPSSSTVLPSGFSAVPLLWASNPLRGPYPELHPRAA